MLFIFAITLCVGCGPDATLPLSGTAFDVTALDREAKQFAQKWNLSPYDPLLESHPRSLSFDKYFEPIGIVEIPDSILVSSISSLDVSATGDLVLVDRRSEQAILAKADGTFMSRLDTERCDPGYAFRPMEAIFAPDGSILVISNTSPSGFYFSETGDCVESVDLHAVPHGVAIIREQVIVYNARRDGHEISSIARDGTRRVIASGKRFSIINSRWRGLRNLVSVDSTSVALLQIQSPTADIISTETGEAFPAGRQPEYYREIQSEVDESVVETSAIFDEINRNMEGRSRSIGVFNLSAELLALIYSNGYVPFQTSPKGVGIQLVSKTGSPIHSDPILIRGFQFGIIGSGHGFLFVTGTYDLGNDESNRPIVVYRVRSENVGS